MNKQLEQLLIVAVLGATAFVLWRAYRNGKSLGALGNLTGANATSLSTPAQRYSVIRPTADSFIDSIYGSGGSGGTGSSGGIGGAQGNGGVTLSNGTLYTAGSDPGYSAGA